MGISNHAGGAVFKVLVYSDNQLKTLQRVEEGKGTSPHFTSSLVSTWRGEEAGAGSPEKGGWELISSARRLH